MAKKSSVRINHQPDGSVRVHVTGAVSIGAACRAAHSAMKSHSAPRATLHLGTVFTTDVEPHTPVDAVRDRYNAVRNQRKAPADIWTPIQTKLR